MNTDGEFVLSDKEFARVKSRIHEIAGISLSDAKKTLVLSRLTKLLRQRGLSGFDAYLDFLDRQASPQDMQDFVNALTTNLTRFYREDHHFDHLVDYVGRLVQGDALKVKGKPRLRIWSAGCSTGQEPYTIAMALMTAYPQLKSWDFRILATDVDTNVVATAATGLYGEGDLAGLSPERAKVFEHRPGGRVAIPEHMRSLVTFKPLNLMGEWPVKGPFDAIFCRNVTIYFDKPTQRDVMQRFQQVLRPGGFLYIGHSENIGSSIENLVSVGKTVYCNRSADRKREVA